MDVDPTFAGQEYYRVTQWPLLGELYQAQETRDLLRRTKFVPRLTMFADSIPSYR